MGKIYINRPKMNPVCSLSFVIAPHEEEQFFYILEKGIKQCEESGGVSEEFLQKLREWVNGKE